MGDSKAWSSLALLSQKDKQCAQNNFLIKRLVCSVKLSLLIPFAVLATPWLLALSACPWLCHSEVRGCGLEQLDAAFEVTVVSRVIRLGALLSKGQI